MEKRKAMVVNVNGTSFYKGTPQAVMDQLEWARQANVRIRIFLGDENGKEWHEEFETIGYIGRSTGQFKVPLLLPNSRSTGGGAILTDRIVKIVDIRTKRVVYQQANYSPPTWEAHEGSEHEGYSAHVTVQENGGKPSVYGNCRSMAQARHLAEFMAGKRHSK